MKISASGIPHYRYQCDDKSILLPYLNRFVLDPITPFVPLSIHPNLITTVAFFASVGCLASSLYFSTNSVAGGLLGALFIFIYFTLDNFDGRQAKRTIGGSALGEYFDHYLDALTSGILLVALYFRIGFPTPEWILWILGGVYSVTASISWYQKQTGHLFFGKFSPFETSVLVCLLFIASVFDGFRNAVLLIDPNLALWISAIILMLMAKDVVLYLRKSTRFSAFLIVYAVVLFAIPAIPMQEAVYWKMGLMIGFGAAFTGKLLFAYLSGQENPTPDVVPVIGILAMSFLFPEKAFLIGSSGAIGMIGLAIYRFVYGAMLLKKG